VWLSKLQPISPVFDDDPRLPAWGEQNREYDEMKKCQSVDPVGYVDYAQVMKEIVADRTIRMGRFMHRHNLLEQFYHENPRTTPPGKLPKVELAANMETFLRNHKLMAQFEKEDANIHRLSVNRTN
jgi:hypothetical protein